MSRSTILIFRIQLLPRSETFILNQAIAMSRFEPYFVGWRRVAGLELPANRYWVVDGGGPFGKVRELYFRYRGPSSKQVDELRRHGPRLIYAHFALDGYAALPLARALDVPLITALHGYDVTMNDSILGSTRLGREYLSGRRQLQDEGALFLCCSDFVRKRALALGYPTERTRVHSIGVDLTEFQPPSRHQREKTVLFVGRLVEKKGCGDLIEAMATVQKQCPNASLAVIGEGPLRETYERAAAEQHLRCQFLGGQPSTVVKEWMARASVLCVPSVVAASGDAEGLGMVFLEAQATGLPVVSTQSGGIPEAVEDGKTGLLVPEHCPDALAEAILAVLQNETRWHTFSAAGRKNVVQHFDLTRQTAHLEEAFAQLLA